MADLTDDLTQVLNAIGTGEQRVQPSNIQAWLEFTDLTGAGTDGTEGPVQPIAGLSKVPITHLTLQFPLNGIATADFILAVGTDVTTGKVAAIQEALDALENKVRISCYVQINGRENPSRRWPKAPFRIWDGLTIGPGYTQSRENTSFTIHSEHWIAELDHATVASQDLIKNAADNFLVAYGYQTGQSGFAIASVQAIEGLAPGVPPGELWSDMIRPMLTGLMTVGKAQGDGGILEAGQNWEKALLDSPCKLADVGDVVDPSLGNQRAVNIIKSTKNNGRFDGSSILDGSLNFNYQDYSGNVRTFAATALASRVAQASCLEKMLMCASQFMFKLIHNVETATMAPHMPVVNISKIWRTIYPSEYYTVSGTGYMPRKLAGVVLVGMNSYIDTNAMSTSGNPIGAFRRYKEGQMLMANAPDWLNYQVPPEDGIDPNKRTAMSPNASTPPDRHKDDDGQLSDQRNLGCRLAKAVWYEEVYRNRTAQLTGRLRFDICPGSMIELVTAGASLPQATGPLYATVSQVTIQIDAADPRAHTVLGLSHIRTVPSGVDWADAGHPVYPDEPWFGSPLVKLADSDMTPDRDD